MSDASPSSVHEDLAFLRSLVDEDWRPSVWSFGAIYLAIGIVLIVHMGISATSSALALAPPIPALAYLALYSVFTVVTFMIGARSRHLFGTSGAENLQGKASSVKGRAGSAALGGAFLAHLALLIAFGIAAARNDSPVMMELLPLSFFVLQSVAWVVVHAMRRARWHLWEAWAWLAAAIGCAPLVGTPWFGLAVAVTAFALMVVPGVYMMTIARKPA